VLAGLEVPVRDGADGATGGRVAKLDHVFSLVARHPLLTWWQLAILVGTT